MSTTDEAITLSSEKNSPEAGWSVSNDGARDPTTTKEKSVTGTEETARRVAEQRHSLRGDEDEDTLETNDIAAGEDEDGADYPYIPAAERRILIAYLGNIDLTSVDLDTLQATPREKMAITQVTLVQIMCSL